MRYDTLYAVRVVLPGPNGTQLPRFFVVAASKSSVATSRAMEQDDRFQGGNLGQAIGVYCTKVKGADVPPAALPGWKRGTVRIRLKTYQRIMQNVDLRRRPR